MRRKPIDYDALLKDFISDFFPDFIAFANPDLLRTQSNLNLDRSVKLLIFVRDFVHLPKKLENEFLQS